jgi:predicted dehydrogenase
MKKVGIVGLGHQARDYIAGMADAAHATLAAVCDVNEELLHKWTSELGVRGYTDHRSLLATEKLDFVIVTTPHDVHRETIACAAQTGVHVLKEKPFARHLREAVEMRELCAEANVHLMTAIQRRFNPMYVHGVELMREIGTIEFVEAKYTMFLDNPLAGWRGDKLRSGGGTLIDMGYHMVDLLVWYFGLPQRVLAEFKPTDKPEITSTVLFGFDSGVHGLLVMSRQCPPRSEYLRILGSRGILEVGRSYLKKMRPNGDVIESIVREHAAPSVTAKQIDYFCRVIDGREENIGSPDYHLQHVRFTDACYRSQELGQYVNPLKLEDLCLTA